MYNDFVVTSPYVTFAKMNTQTSNTEELAMAAAATGIWASLHNRLVAENPAARDFVDQLQEAVRRYTNGQAQRSSGLTRSLPTLAGQTPATIKVKDGRALIAGNDHWKLADGATPPPDIRLVAMLDKSMPQIREMIATFDSTNSHTERSTTTSKLLSGLLEHVFLPEIASAMVVHDISSTSSPAHRGRFLHHIMSPQALEPIVVPAATGTKAILQELGRKSPDSGYFVAETALMALDGRDQPGSTLTSGRSVVAIAVDAFMRTTFLGQGGPLFDGKTQGAPNAISSGNGLI